MSLSKKHFVKIAEILNQRAKDSLLWTNQEKGGISEQLINRITEDLSDYFATENAQFDRERFKQAVLKGCSE